MAEERESAESSAPSALRRGVSRALFPVVFVSVLVSATYWLRTGVEPDLVVLTHSVASVVVVALMEIWLTYERRWRHSHGDVGPDVMHMLVSNIGMSAFTSALIIPGCVMLATWLSSRMGLTLWPTEWPLVLQGLLAIVISELPYYWFHRLSHEVEFLWRFHSVHHSVPRLYWLNAGRFHPVDAFIGYVVQAAPLVILGASPEALAWHAIFLSTHGPFQHSNIDLRLGPLNWVFSMAELHRWHHSRDAEEGNTNYGGNIILWDVVFGTRFLPKRKPSADIGVCGMPEYPTSYLGQLAAPFRWAALHGAKADEADEQPP